MVFVNFRDHVAGTFFLSIAQTTKRLGGIEYRRMCSYWALNQEIPNNHTFDLRNLIVTIAFSLCCGFFSCITNKNKYYNKLRYFFHPPNGFKYYIIYFIIRKKLQLFIYNILNLIK
jgi:hypothetical protein